MILSKPNCFGEFIISFHIMKKKRQGGLMYFLYFIPNFIVLSLHKSIIKKKLTNLFIILFFVVIGSLGVFYMYVVIKGKFSGGFTYIVQRIKILTLQNRRIPEFRCEA